MKGTLGLLSYFVAQSTREIGVRVALGAARTGLMGLVIASGLKIVAVGVGAGCVLTIASATASCSKTPPSLNP